MSEDDFEPFLRTALVTRVVSRVRRRYDQIFGRGSLRERAQGEKAAVRAEAEAALDRDPVMESYMEDPDDSEATNAARSRLRNAPEPPSKLEAASRGCSYLSDVIKDTCLHLHWQHWQYRR